MTDIVWHILSYENISFHWFTIRGWKAIWLSWIQLFYVLWKIIRIANSIQYFWNNLFFLLGNRSLYFLKTVSIVTLKKIQRYTWLTTARWFAVIDVMYFCVWLFVNVLFFRAIKIYLLHKKITSMIRGRDKNNHEIEMKLGASWFIWYSFKTIWWMSMSISLYDVIKLPCYPLHARK